MSKLLTKFPDLASYFSKNVLQCVKDQAERGLVNNKLDLQYLQEWATQPDRYILPKASFDTFIDSPHYLGMGNTIYPKIREIAKEIIEGKYRESVIVAGIGSGKTFISELLAAYSAHELLCLRNPYREFGLAKDKPITLLNMGTTATQALDNCFAGIRKIIETSPWFQYFNPFILKESIHFDKQGIRFISGNSQATKPLGYNIFYAVLDEAAFYLDNDNKQVAKDIYDALQRRIVSRFGSAGRLVVISSPRYEGDFIMQKLEDANKNPDLIYAKHMPTWKCKPMSKADMDNKFYFNTRTGLIEDDVAEVKKGNVTYVKDDSFIQTADFWEVPGEYKVSFKSDPDKAKRDFGAIPSMSIQAFMPHLDMIQAMFTEDPSPVTSSGDYKFSEDPLRVSYYIHIDLALNKDGKGDHAGIAMAHFDGWEINETTGEKQKKVVIDLAEKISAGKTGEIRFEDVRNKIYTLKKKGFNIRKVTLDQFQSTDTIQTLRSKGIRAEYQSVDRTVEPYQTLKELIYSGRVKCHKSDDLRDELRRLEITKSSKIDHPPGGSKDVSDAVCGAVYAVMQSPSSEMGIATGDLTTINSNPTQINTVEQKEAYYRKLQEMNDKGWLAR